MTAVSQPPSTLPLLGGPVYRSSQATVLRDRMSAVAVGHEVYPLAGRLNGIATGHHLGTVHLAYVRYGAPTRVVAAPTGETVCWTLPLGPMRVDWGTGRAGAYAGQGFVLNRDRETTMLPEPVLGAVVLTAAGETLSAHLDQLTGAPRCADRIAPGPPPGRHGGLIDAAWRHAAAVLSAVPDPPPGLRRQLEDSLLTSLALELSGWEPHDVPGSPSLARAHVARAEAWAREALHQPVEVGVWAAAVGLSVRHLQKCFREVHGCTPMAYLQALRLEGAHHDLRTQPRRPVSEVATAWGFTHLGRFAALHRARYGVTPSEVRDA